MMRLLSARLSMAQAIYSINRKHGVSRYCAAKHAVLVIRKYEAAK